MRHFKASLLGAVVTGSIAARGLTLDELCDTAYIQSALPTDFAGIVFDNASITVAIQNYTSAGTSYNYCNLTMAYGHAGLNDTILVNYWLPEPASFSNRYLSTGGGGPAINSGLQASAAALPYGAVGGITDGGFGGFASNFNTDGVDVLANGTLNWQTVISFGYRAHNELVTIGKALTTNVYAVANGTKVYAYYEGCSEGGREGMSQIQRYTDFDGVIIGAPAFRYAHQQTNHMFSAIAEQTIGYVPPPCELAYIVNATIAACDPLDGRTDGVVARTDLCKLNYNISVLIGETYSCAAAEAAGRTPASPAQSGTVSQEAIDVCQTILDGLMTSDGERAYFSWQPSASFSDATSTSYDNATNTWGLPSVGLAAPFIGREIEEREVTLISTENVTYDTLRDWMNEGMQKFYSSLQTTWPDLSAYQAAGGKIIHYHGESDDSIPAASSAYYYENVAEIMFPNTTYNASHEALADFYRFFLVPGAGHCSTNALQPNGPFPLNPLDDLIAWVEQGVVPETLNATVASGDYAGDQPLCSWPLRPTWDAAGTQSCQYDQSSIDSWHYKLDAFEFPVY
jgi:tannase